jgi:hypothetical protein
MFPRLSTVATSGLLLVHEVGSHPVCEMLLVWPDSSSTLLGEMLKVHRTITVIVDIAVVL